MSQVQSTDSEERRRKGALLAFSAIQAAAAAFFLYDAVTDLTSVRIDPYTGIEAVIAIGLVAGSVFGIRELRRSHGVIARQQTALAVASGALAEVIDTQFGQWGLTPAEHDVGMLALKGFDIAEIARLRGAAQGTVRAQMTAIYAKSGTSGRAQFAAFFVEDLLGDGLRPEGREAAE